MIVFCLKTAVTLLSLGVSVVSARICFYVVEATILPDLLDMKSGTWFWPIMALTIVHVALTSTILGSLCWSMFTSAIDYVSLRLFRSAGNANPVSTT